MPQFIQGDVQVTFPEGVLFTTGGTAATRDARVRLWTDLPGAEAVDTAVAQGLGSTGFTVVEELVAQPTRSLRGAPPAVVQVDTGADEGAVLLVDRDGVYEWVVPDMASEAVTREAGPLTFTVPLGLPASNTLVSRGFLSRLALGGLRVLVLKFAAGLVVDRVNGALIRHFDRFTHGLRSITPEPPGEDAEGAWPFRVEVKKPQDRPLRVLLFVHGTFSSSVGGFGSLTLTAPGRRLLQRFAEEYDGVLGFDHPTLGADPLENARELYTALHSEFGDSGELELHAIAHSRGGLVVRSLAESVLPGLDGAAWRPVLKRAVFVACTHSGTELARPANIKRFVDTYTTLALGAGRVLSLLPGAAPASAIVGEVLRGVSELVKTFAARAFEQADLPGLAAQVPDGEFVTRLNAQQPGQPGPDAAAYYVVSSDFEPGSDAGMPLELPARMRDHLRDWFRDTVMNTPNDLTVNVSSMTAIDGSPSRFVDDALHFVKSAHVYHSNYFIQPEVIRALRHWLGPQDQAGEKLRTAKAAPLLPPETPVAEAVEQALQAGRTYVTVASQGPATGSGAASLVRVTALRSAGPAARTAPVSRLRKQVSAGPSGEPRLPSPDLRRRTARALRFETLEGEEQGDDTLTILKSELADAPPAEAKSVPCHVNAEMPQRVQVNALIPLNVTLSLEQSEDPSGSTSQSGVINIRPQEILSVEVVSRRNVTVVGTDAQSVTAPQPGAPVPLTFHVQVTRKGTAEVDVLLRQGAERLLRLTLAPKGVLVLKAASRARTKSTKVVKSQSVSLLPLHTLEITREEQGDEVRLNFTLRSDALDLNERGTSMPFSGAAKLSFVEDVLTHVEEKLGRDDPHAAEDLRILGAVMLKELFPANVRAKLWENRAALDGLMLVTDEPGIPWELVHLSAPNGALPDERAFLGDLGLVRWPYNSWPQRALEVRARRGYFVAPRQDDLPAVQAEIQYVKSTFGALPVKPRVADICGLLKTGEFDLLHFACHGAFHAEAALKGELQVEDGRLRSADVEAYQPSEADAGAVPLVVVNACHSGRLGLVLTRIDGFAQAFLNRGAGAFVGTSWSVTDSLAANFSSTLYEAWLDGQTLAQASMAARQAASTATDPTGLGYVVYGHPHARLTRR